MTTMKFLSFNGNIIGEGESSLLNNRGFFFGDGFFESMHWHDGKILFADAHLERINIAFNILKLDESTLNFQSLQKEAKELIEKNKLKGDARIRMTFFRVSEGNYTPLKNNTGRMINVKPLDTNGFTLNEVGLSIGVYHEQTKSRSSISNLKTLNSLVYVLAGIYARDHSWDDVLILNDTGNIIEAHTSNIFIVMGNKLYTPPLSDGCVNGVMRKQILKLAEQTGISCAEKSLLQKDIDVADELILSNAVQGIRWVEKAGNNTYKKSVAELLYNNLNKHFV